MKKSLYYYTSLFAWGVVFLLIVFYAFAWNPPTDNPPNANLPAPINTSSVEQTKTGNLNLGGLLRLGLLTSHPTGTNGAIYYNTTDNKFYGYQNNEWKELGSGGGASFWLASGNNIYNTNTGNVGIGTTEPGAKLDVNGDIKIKYPGIKLQTDSDGDLWITANAYYDGSNWQRENTSQESFGIEMMRAGNIIYESMPGVVIWRAVPGSNPIGPFTTYGGWEASLISTYYKDLVVGGATIEMDGNGLLPYGRLIHSNPSGNIYTGIGRNIYGDFSGRDKTDQPSWFSGFANDTFTVKRAPSGSSVNFTDFLNITNSGNVGIGTTSPGVKLEVHGFSQLGSSGMVGIGRSANEYDYIGYNIVPSGIANVFNYKGNDTASALQFLSGGFKFRGATSGTGGNQITFNDLMVIQQNGNVGIGTTGPLTLLDLRKISGSGLRLSANDNTANAATIDLLESTANAAFGTVSAYGARLMYEGVDNRFYLKMGNQDSVVTALSVDRNSGNVGIGTTGPSRKLFVNGDAGGTTGWYNDSDARLKTNVQTIPNALEKVEKMRGVNFEWIDTENHPKGLQVGFIAQELKDVLPEVVDKKGEYYSVQESSITAVLVEAIKEQQKEIENQQKQIEDLKAQIETLKNY